MSNRDPIEQNAHIRAQIALLWWSAIGLIVAAAVVMFGG